MVVEDVYTSVKENVMGWYRVNWSGKGNGNRGLGAPTLNAACAACARGEVERMLAMTRNAAVVVAGEGGRGGLGERESGGCAIGGDPWQSAHSLVGLRLGRVRASRGWLSPVQVWTLRRGA